MNHRCLEEGEPLLSTCLSHQLFVAEIDPILGLEAANESAACISGNHLLESTIDRLPYASRAQDAACLVEKCVVDHDGGLSHAGAYAGRRTRMRCRAVD